MSHKRFLAGAIASTALMMSSIAPLQAQETVTMAVTDVAGLEELRRDWGPFAEALEQYTGFGVEFAPVTSRTAAVELLRSEEVDFVLTGPAEYVVMQELTGAEPVLGFSRPDYFSGIITMADSGITSVDDLRGERVAVGDVGSTSSHLAPLQLLADYGLDPQEDVELTHTAERVAYEALKRGDVAAWGTNYMDDYIRLRSREEELSPGAFRVIARGPDLPNDVLVAGSHVPEQTIETLRDAVVENSDALVAAIVEDGGEENLKYEGMRFIANIDDSDYDYVRDAYGAIGQERFDRFAGE
ncbi:phosphate/phosphite/phosphonate ABC transporter substrate-binding protein [Sediminicurvatus halobius]|uniref:Phosphonate ABC transporter substrate-binding protein n=1 Tax=Sediminicurvatus halobius TaxID=2182432 RepID=A0A2U2MWF9_9GAMM|nr:phosphate/phosphite/phosphonate ABC transporter substrate-binding protein [Spiribacter halobius]PWG61201.1 phosphonate ABC transporter substrate-binding protein [Spiribacter halobius]UEX77939.1 phosphate/phosphite/phosphonate ABC transporter substrate-binding protein [Spiribacter halobius]